MVQKFQEGGLSQASSLLDEGDEEAVNPTDQGLLGVLTAQYTTTPEARRRANEILDQSMSSDAYSTEDDIMQRMRESAEKSREALRQARARILGHEFDPREKWLAAAAAFGTPTRTGAFGETVGNVARSLQGPLAEQRKFKRQKEQDLLGIDEALSGVDQNIFGSELQLSKVRQQLMGQMAREALRTLGKSTRKAAPESPGQKSRNQKMATELVSWQTQGHADAVKSLAELQQALSMLQTSDEISGPWVGMIPKTARDILLPESGTVQDLVETTAQRSLKAILGGQFGQREGEMLLARTFNPRLGEEENHRRAFRLYKMLEIAAEQKNRALKWANTHQGNMEGFDGKFEWTIDDFMPKRGVILPDGRRVEVPENWDGPRIREEYGLPPKSSDDENKIRREARGGRIRYAGGGKARALTELFGIWDTKTKEFVGKPYQNKRRARTRVDKLDNDYGAYRYLVKPIKEPEKPEFAEGGDISLDDLQAEILQGRDNNTREEESPIFTPENIGLFATGTAAGGATGVGGAELLSRLEELSQGIDRGSPAEQRVAQSIEGGGRDPQEVMADVKRGRRMRVPELPFDKSGQLTRTLGEEALMRGGEQADITLDELEKRHSGSRERVTEQVNRGLKPSEFFETEQKLTDRLYERARPLYEKAYKDNPAVKAPEVLFDILESPDGKRAVKIAARLMRNQGKTMGKADVTGMVTKPSLEFLDNVKRGFDQIIRTEENMGPTTLGRSMRGLRKKLVSYLDNPKNVTETYHQARKQFKGDLEVLEALDTGRTQYLRMAPKEAIDMVEGMSPAEIDSLRVGVAQRLYDDINRATSDKNAPQHLLGSPDMPKRLRPLFHTDKEFKIFMAALERERELFEKGKKSIRRSESGRGRRMIEDFLSADEPLENVKNKIGRGPLALALRMIPSFGGRKKLDLSGDEADEIIKILTTSEAKDLDSLGAKLAQVQERTKLRRGRRGKAGKVGAAIGAALSAYGLLGDDDEDEELE